MEPKNEIENEMIVMMVLVWMTRLSVSGGGDGLEPDQLMEMTMVMRQDQEKRSP